MKLMCSAYQNKIAKHDNKKSLLNNFIVFKNKIYDGYNNFISNIFVIDI